MAPDEKDVVVDTRICCLVISSHVNFNGTKNIILVLTMDPCSGNGKSWTEDSGRIILPTKSDGQYRNDADCKWKLQVAPDKVIIRH